jgi:hypothetical protein
MSESQMVVLCIPEPPVTALCIGCCVQSDDMQATISVCFNSSH